jgi:SWI/SNF-related matrix-associated actin-dependent regulator of chromatin subfamily A3
VTQSKKRKGATGSAKNAQSTKIPSPLKEIEWYRVVLDEVHAIKTAHTKQARYCLSLQTRRRWAVTGTVMQTQHDDIATVLQFLRLDPLGIRHMWNNYCGARLDTSRGWRAGRRHRALQQHDAPNPLALLSFTMRDIVMRHTKTQIFEGEQILKLPARTQSGTSAFLTALTVLLYRKPEHACAGAHGAVVMLDMSEHEKNLYKELEQQAQTSFAALEERGQIGKETLRLMSLLLPLRMLCSDPAALSTKQLTPTSTDTASNDDSSAKLLSKQSLKDLFTQKQMAQERIDSIICVLDGSSALTCPVRKHLN